MKTNIAELFRDNYEAQCAYKLLAETNEGVFLTGKAGTGKSKFIEWAKEISQSRCMLLAPTGIAAVNINGKTIHSIFRIPIEDPKRIYNWSYLYDNFKRERRKLFNETDLIIIDEVSMVTAEIMDCMDYIFRQLCNCEKPFADRKVLLVGDPFQLPPTISNKKIANSDHDEVATKYFYESKVFKKLNPIKIELHRNYRQEDETFCTSLNNLREGIELSKTIDYINKKCFFEKQWKVAKEEAMVLTYSKAHATEINNRVFKNLPGEEIEVVKEVWKDGRYVKDPRGHKVVLKIGSRVIINKNDPHGRYANGTCGFLKAFDEKAIVVEDNYGKEIRVTKKVEMEEVELHYGKKKNYKKRDRVIKHRQFPIELGWAMTIHRSQGLTFDNIILANNGLAFCAGQVYVGLSRCTSIEGITLEKPLISIEVYQDRKTKAFYKSMTGWDLIKDRIEEIDAWNLLMELPTQFDNQLMLEVASKNKMEISDQKLENLINQCKLCNWIEEKGNRLYERILTD